MLDYATIKQLLRDRLITEKPEPYRPSRNHNRGDQREIEHGKITVSIASGD